MAPWNGPKITLEVMVAWEECTSKRLYIAGVYDAVTCMTAHVTAAHRACSLALRRVTISAC